VSVPEVQVYDRSGFGIDTGRTAGLAVAVMVRLGFCGGELGVTYVGVAEMEQLNAQYMGRMGATDVLSFPLDADGVELEDGFVAELEAEEPALVAALLPETGSGSDEVPLLLGDVVICPEIAAAQAARRGNTAIQELCMMLIHGILHIAGYDHEADNGEMEKLQKQLFDEMCGG
jgi:probable rRNA maturation factor